MAAVYDPTLFFLSPGPFPSTLFFQLSLSPFVIVIKSRSEGTGERAHSPCMYTRLVQWL